MRLVNGLLIPMQVRGKLNDFEPNHAHVIHLLLGTLPFLNALHEPGSLVVHIEMS